MLEGHRWRARAEAGLDPGVDAVFRVHRGDKGFERNCRQSACVALQAGTELREGQALFADFFSGALLALRSAGAAIGQMRQRMRPSHLLRAQQEQREDQGKNDFAQVHTADSSLFVPGRERRVRLQAGRCSGLSRLRRCQRQATWYVGNRTESRNPAA